MIVNLLIYRSYLNFPTSMNSAHLSTSVVFIYIYFGYISQILDNTF